MLRKLLVVLATTLLVAACASEPPPPPPPPPVAAPPSFMVFFDWDRSNLSQQAVQTVGQAAAAFKARGNARITATGHTDTTGPESYNMALSLRRANAVKDELVRQGVPAPAITVIGKGESQLLVPTGDNVREPQNRRVEIVISGQMAAVPVSNDLAYCRALSSQYRRLLGGTQSDVIAGDALARCEAGDTGYGIATLTKILTDAKVALPPRT